jgi:tRNA threonylcarbamoyladenosine biosynthesis protein TsaE
VYKRINQLLRPLKLVIRTEAELLPAAKQLIAAHPAGRIFAFYGQMGTGKTTFIKAICHELGVTDIVQSPTFSIINEYKTVKGEPVFHFDFYRIKKLEEVFDIGYEDYIYSGSYCFLEWPELIASLLPEDVIPVRITGQSERELEF